MSVENEILANEISHTNEVSANEISQISEVSATEISQTNEVLAKEISQTKGSISIFQNDNDDPINVLRELRKKNRDRPILAHLNINHLDPKFDPLKDMIINNVDIFFISETKLDENFPEGQYFIEGYKEPIRLDRNKHGGGILFFVRDDLECVELKPHKLPKEVEAIFLSLKIRNTKWLIMGGYNPKKNNISNFLEHISKQIDHFLPKYENLMFLGDFNSEISEQAMYDFCETYSLENLIKHVLKA